MEISLEKKLSEEDIKLRFITPAITRTWKKTQVKMEQCFTDGRVIVNENTIKRGEKKKADYILYYKSNIPLAVVEAKSNRKSLHDGIQQAIEYATILDIPFAYSSNGDAFLEHDFLNGTEKEIPLEKFPSPEELWSRYTKKKKITQDQEKIVQASYFYRFGDNKTPRYYQRIAINRTVEAVSKGKNRILLVMATGTGKTYTAFQIVYRLWKSKLKRKILYLADRNVLIDQAMQQDFNPLNKIMTKVQDRTLDPAYEVYFSLYQQLAGNEFEEPFRTLKPKFFDLIIIDECHRGSVAEESQWRKILEYFTEATQIGMTATPKETNEVSNIEYFGEPIYTYSLCQGIDDGFLAPYKLIRINLNTDLEGYRPEVGKLDKSGNIVENREYNVNDFDKNLVIDERTEAVAKRITEFLKNNDRFSKTIVFCIDIEHAGRMRTALLNENSDLVKSNNNYVVKITGDDEIGKRELDNFLNPESPCPALATTSELLSTGVDCKTCKLIVLDKNISSSIELKQIIGRGTRLFPQSDKKYFTIMDFRGVTRQFANDAFWAKPEQVEEYNSFQALPFGKEKNALTPDPNPEHKVYIDSVDVKILSERIQCYDKDDKIITENFLDYTKQNILGQYANLENFLKAWNSQECKEAILDELKKHGVSINVLRKFAGYKNVDDFDLICHIAFDKKPLTRAERVNQVKKSAYLNTYEGLAREVLAALLDKYAQYGINEITDITVLQAEPFPKMGGAVKIVKLFGGREHFLEVLHELHKQLYAA